MLRAAMIGLGWWGKNLVGSVQGKSAAIRFDACQTRTAGAAEDFCRKHAIRLVDDYEQILADPAIDAVVLATPPAQHGDQMRRAAAAGKHVFVEKPFTLTVDEAKRTLAAAQEAGIVLAVGFNRRFHPSFVELRRRLREGQLGTTLGCMVEQTAGGGESMRPTEWRADQTQTPAGAMTGIGIHIVDALINLFGRITQVHCIATRRAAPLVDDTTAVLVRFRDGMSATFFCSFVTVPHYRLAVYGSRGFAEILRPTLEELRVAPLTDVKAGHLALFQPEVITTPGFDTLAAELEAFAAAADGGPPYPVTAEEALHGVEVFEAIARSARSGEPVTLPT
jgi:predicted dehydrogenase